MSKVKKTSWVRRPTLIGFNRKYGMPRPLNRVFYPVVISRLNKHWKELSRKYYYPETDGDIVVWVEGWIDAYDVGEIVKKTEIGSLARGIE